MQTLNIHEIQSHLLRLNDFSEPFIITKSGKPVAQVVPYVENKSSPQRIGFLQNWHMPDDFDETDDEIIALFAGSDDEILA